jgi:hypothetical protein
MFSAFKNLVGSGQSFGFSIDGDPLQQPSESSVWTVSNGKVWNELGFLAFFLLLSFLHLCDTHHAIGTCDVFLWEIEFMRLLCFFSLCQLQLLHMGKAFLTTTLHAVLNLQTLLVFERVIPCWVAVSIDCGVRNEWVVESSCTYIVHHDLAALGFFVAELIIGRPRQPSPSSIAWQASADGAEVTIFSINLKEASAEQGDAARNALRRMKMLRHPNFLRYIDSREVRSTSVLPLLSVCCCWAHDLFVFMPVHGHPTLSPFE